MDMKRPGPFVKLKRSVDCSQHHPPRQTRRLAYPLRRNRHHRAQFRFQHSTTEPRYSLSLVWRPRTINVKRSVVESMGTSSNLYLSEHSTRYSSDLDSSKTHFLSLFTYPSPVLILDLLRLRHNRRHFVFVTLGLGTILTSQDTKYKNR